MALPEEFSSYTRQLMGEELFATFLRGMEEEPPASIRLNPLKCPLLQPEESEPVPWCEGGYYLKNRPNFTFDPLLHAGYYYVQEASSMFIDRVLRQYVPSPVYMLDLCAAPGGKSTAARAALPAGSLLVSNEPVRQRAQILSENIQKWGHPDCIVTNNYPIDFRRSKLMFDVILCDVPCSGEGMFRKNPEAIAEWSPQNVERCSQLQREIVADAWQCLRPNGLLIYSTCTYNTKENEENVAWFCSELDASVLPADICADWNITGSLLEGFHAPVYRFIPGKTRGEGLFMAILRKPAGDTEQTHAKSMRDQIRKALKPLYDGIPEATAKGKDRIPSQAQALATSASNSDYPHVELSYGQAMQYLRREAIAIPDAPRGLVLVTFRGAPLGFAKNIGNRANNLYPQEWKIKTTHTPKEYETILRLA